MRGKKSKAEDILMIIIGTLLVLSASVKSERWNLDELDSYASCVAAS